MADADRIALRFIKEATFGTTPGVTAQGTLTMDTMPTDADTFTLDAKTYTFQTALTDVDGNIAIGGSLAQAKLNLVAAVNLTGTAGTNYALSMTLHPTISAAAFIVDDAILTAKSGGIVGDTLVTTETFTAGTNVFDAATLGTTKAGVDAVFIELRLAGESFGQSSETTNSAEIRSDRQIADVIRTSAQADGDITTELSYKAYDEFFEGAFQSAGFSTEVSETDTTYSMAAADNSINDSASAFITDGFLVNQWILVSGFGTAANNAVFKIVSVVAGKIVLSGGTVVTEAAGASVTIKMGAQIVNGTTQPSFSIEKEFTDLTDDFALLSGLTIDTMNLSVAAQAIITGSFAFIGDASVSATRTSNTAATTAAPTNEIMAAVDDVEALLENQTKISAVSFTFDLANNLRTRPIIAKLTPDSIGAGAVAISGTLQLYYTDSTIMDKYLAFTTTSLVLNIKDGAGNRYLLEMPQVKLSEGKRVAGSQNTDILADFGYAAFRSPTELITARLVRWDAA